MYQIVLIDRNGRVKDQENIIYDHFSDAVEALLEKEFVAGEEWMITEKEIE